MSAPKKDNKDLIIPLTTLAITLFLVVVYLVGISPQRDSSRTLTPSSSNDGQLSSSNLIDLPHPGKDSRLSVEQALSTRRSYRSFLDESVSLDNLSQLLWSAQGVTVNWGGRTAPSFKSAYPLTLYAIADNVSDLDQGIYQYLPGDIQPIHQLTPVQLVDLQAILEQNTDQYSLHHAPLIIAITGDMEKMTQQNSGQHNDIAVYLEAGHVAQNLFLQSESLGLGMATISSFNQDTLKSVLHLPDNQTLIYLIPIGHPKK